MTLKEIEDVFFALGLFTNDQRQKILSQGISNVSYSTYETKKEFQTWASNQSRKI